MLGSFLPIPFAISAFFSPPRQLIIRPKFEASVFERLRLIIGISLKFDAFFSASVFSSFPPSLCSFAGPRPYVRGEMLALHFGNLQLLSSLLPQLPWALSRQDTRPPLSLLHHRPRGPKPWPASSPSLRWPAGFGLHHRQHVGAGARSRTRLPVSSRRLLKRLSAVAGSPSPNTSRRSLPVWHRRPLRPRRPCQHHRGASSGLQRSDAHLPRPPTVALSATGLPAYAEWGDDPVAGGWGGRGYARRAGGAILQLRTGRHHLQRQSGVRSPQSGLYGSRLFLQQSGSLHAGASGQLRGPDQLSERQLPPKGEEWTGAWGVELSDATPSTTAAAATCAASSRDRTAATEPSAVQRQRWWRQRPRRWGRR